MANIAKRSTTIDKTNKAIPPKAADWAICDISGSMHCEVGNGKRRIDCLNAALMELGDDVQVIAFSDDISRERVGQFTPQGGTMLCPALREVVKYEPSYIVLISDGQINDSQVDALGLVDKIALSAVIDCIYIGPDDSRAEQFMRDVATAAHGRFRKYDPSTIVEKMQTLLPAPSGPLEMSEAPIINVTSKPTNI